MNIKTFVYDDNGLTVIDPRSLDDSIGQNLSHIRKKCSDVILEAGLDQVTQNNAIAGIYPPERCEAIKSYIAACRNEYLRCKELILAAQTNDEADAVPFVAPPVPEGM